jgi:hypothetical protein
MLRRFTVGRDARVNLLVGAGHFLSHFYQLCLSPLFIAWQQAFDVSFAELGLAMAVMSGTRHCYRRRWGSSSTVMAPDRSLSAAHW